MSRRAAFAVLLASAGCSTSDGARADAPDDLNAVLEPIRAQYNLPSLAASVWRRGVLVGQGAVGVRKIDDPARITTNDVWHLGSDTKAMTATLIGIYVDRGKIHFEDTISSIFAGEAIDPGYRDVTIEQLLQHRGGAPGSIPADVFAKMGADGTAPGALMTAVRTVISRPPAQSPGTFVYANLGYMIAGAALERTAGQTWERIIQQELFLPLKMDSCGFGPPGTLGAVDEPWGHAADGARVVPMQLDNPPSLGPAGTVHCALPDWGRFLTLHVVASDGVASLVSSATMRRLQTPAAGDVQAAGWMVSQGGPNGTVLTHAGSNSLFYATAMLVPGRGELAFAVVTNRGGDIATQAVKDSALALLIQKYAN